MKCCVFLKDQIFLEIDGVEKMKFVSTEQIILEIETKELIVNGEGMEVQTLDLENKKLIVNGLVKSIRFAEKKEKFFKRIFK